MSAPGGGYKMESQEARALGSITTDSYDYRDQAKLLTKLTTDVSYMASYMRTMQKGIDDANKNFIQQIQDLLAELLTLISGGGDTGFEWGDLKYIFQAFGALFGFDSATGIASIFPINLFSAAWHFFSTYIIPVDEFGEFIDWIIDQFIAWVLDIFGDIPIVGQALQQFAVWLTQIRDLIHSFAELFGAWTKPLVDFIVATVNWIYATFVAWTEPIATFVLNAINWLWEILGHWTRPIVDWIFDSVTWLANLFGAWTEPIVSWITNSLNFLTSLFSDWSVGFTKWLTDTVAWLGAVFAAWTEPIATWVTTSLTWLAEVFAAWTEPIATWVTSTLQFLFDLFEDWTAPFVSVISQVVDAVQQIVDWFVGGIGTAISNLFPWAKKLPQMQIVEGQEVIKTSNVPTIDATKVGSGQFPGERIGSNAITAPKLADYAVTTGKIGYNAVTTFAISPNAVTSTEISNGSIIGDKLASYAVTNGKIAQDAVGTNELAPYAVTNTELAGNAVATSNLQNGSVTGGKTADLDGSKFTTGQINVNLLPTDAIGQRLSTTGSGAMLVRSSTSPQAVTPNAGPQIIPGGFYNSYTRKSNDINILSGYTGLQVTLGGWYMVEIAYKVNANASWGWSLAPVLFVNGGVSKYGTDCMYTWTGINSAGAQRYVQNSFIVYLDSYHYVQAGYDCAMGAAANSDVLGGGNGSSDTYFSISLLNRSYA